MNYYQVPISTDGFRKVAFCILSFFFFFYHKCFSNRSVLKLKYLWSSSNNLCWQHMLITRCRVRIKLFMENYSDLVTATPHNVRKYLM